MPMPAATLTRRMPHYRLSPRRCRGLTANETALRSICLFLGVVGGVAASGTALRSKSLNKIDAPPVGEQTGGAVEG